MYNFRIIHPQNLTKAVATTNIGDVVKVSVQLTATKDCVVAQDAISIGFCGDTSKCAILTHQLTITRNKLPFAFPGAVALGTKGEGLALVGDYYNISLPLRFVYCNAEEGIIALVNDQTELKKGQTLCAEVYYSLMENCTKMFAPIGKCADIVLSLLDYTKYEYQKAGGQIVSSYHEASLGLVSNLMDKRAIVNDGTGTFNPYGYHEIGAYSESFCCMDVAKGFYRFAKSNNLEGPLEYIRNQVRHLCDTSQKHPWIANCHNTEGFFHFAWGAIPQDSGVDPNIDRSDLYSDYCGHEEGENLLSTFKYFDRVNLLGEVALIENDEEIVQGFLKVLPFVESLRNEDFTQPVTYNLDTHQPVTGNDNGGSAGGCALYALIQFNAYRITKEKYHLEYALKSVDAGNKLDYDRMYSMRCAPKPIAIGALVRANVVAYEFTNDKHYLDTANHLVEAIFSSYYLCPHPYGFFSIMGFGYACAQERWEAFREMEEALWFILPIVKYTNNPSILKLFSLNKQNAICALPINGNPYGNMQRDYESFGGEYIPFEFPTGHIGDNPGLCGGSQSDRRQIKEIYGCGELFLAAMMYENYARSHDASLTILSANCFDSLPTDNFDFCAYNAKQKQNVVVEFPTLQDGTYLITMGNTATKYSSKLLNMGVVLCFESGVTHFNVKKVEDGCKELQFGNATANIAYSRVLDKVNIKLDGDYQYYTICDESSIGTKWYKTTQRMLDICVDSEVPHKIEVCGVVDSNVDVLSNIRLDALTKEFVYDHSFDQNSNVSTTNFDMVSDGHIAMFYRSDLAQDSAKICVDIGNVDATDSVLELQIGAVNSGTTYSISLVCGDESVSVAKDQTVANYYAMDVSLVGDCKLIVEANTMYGLGLSIAKLNIAKISKTKNGAVLPLNSTSNGVKADLLDGYKYAVVVVTDMTSNDKFSIAVDGQPMFSPVEQQFMYKVDRSNRGAFKIVLPKGAKQIEVTTQNPSQQFVKAIRLTNSCEYPVLTDYINIDDVRKYHD